jgi:hypothetical protein
VTFQSVTQSDSHVGNFLRSPNHETALIRTIRKDVLHQDTIS